MFLSRASNHHHVLLTYKKTNSLLASISQLPFLHEQLFQRSSHLTNLVIELNTDIQFCLIDDEENESVEFNNNEAPRQEANNKKKGCQFKLSLPVVIDTADRSFLSKNNEAQGGISCSF